MEDWTRTQYFDDTVLPWVKPSPNMRSLSAAIAYPGLGALEGTNLSAADKAKVFEGNARKVYPRINQKI
jgi:uncharacterized protein YbbC (DUF1343 family)